MLDIDKANEKAFQTLMSAKPMWIDIQKAIDIIPGMKKNLILHSGPPITWDRMCGPQRGAVIGALIYEGLAKTPEEAEKLAASGEIEYDPCHHHQAVGPMAGIISASMPVIVTENETAGNVAFNTLNEGIGKVLRMGAYSEDVIVRLKWMENTLAPILQKAIKKAGKIELKNNIIAPALHMGDELHNRSRAASYLLLAKMTPYLFQTMEDLQKTTEVFNFMEANVHNFLGWAMSSAKASLDACRDIEGCTMVTVMARNGTDFGIQVSGLGNQWFTAPAPVPEVLLFPGFTQADVNPDMGDSAITETYGVGGCAIAAAPAIIQFVGGTAKLALQKTLSMYDITIGENTTYQIPALDFRGTPTGFDIRKIVELDRPPFIDTGVAHRKPGIGQVGAGLVDAPMKVFRDAIEAFVEKYADQLE